MMSDCGCTDDTVCPVMAALIRRWLADPSIEGVLAAIFQHEADRKDGIPTL